MRRLALGVLIAVLSVVVAGAAPESACGRPLGAGQNRVLCCCDTASGTCCVYTSICSNFLPGCMCSPQKGAAE